MAGDDTATTPIFADTSALYARIDETDAHHEQARAVFEGIRDGDLPYRPLFVTSHVLGELATLAMIRLDISTARRTIARLRASRLVTILHPGADAFATAAATFTDEDDGVISLVDHLTAAAAHDRDVSHVFAFDDDFRDLGLTVAPADTEDV